MLGILKKIFIFMLLIFSFGLFVAPQSIFAQNNFSSGNIITLTRDKTIDEDYFAAGNTVVLSGTVNGDVYVAGGNVLINGVINGDVLSAGGTVTVSGKVSGNVRVAGGQIIISGDIGKSVTTAGGTITVEEPAKIAGSIVAAGGNIMVFAPIGKGATFAGNQVSIDTAIGGNVIGTIQNLSITKGSSIAGSLSYWSNTKAPIPAGVVGKDVTYHQTNWNTPQEEKQKEVARVGLGGLNVVWELISLISSFIIGWLLLRFTPICMKNAQTILITKPWQSLGVGLLTVILTPIAFVLLLITIIGIPLAVILLFSCIIFVMLIKVFVSYAIGKKFLPARSLLSLLTGLLIYSFVSIIPVIGGLWNMAALLFGIGAIVLAEKELYIVARAKKII